MSIAMQNNENNFASVSTELINSPEISLAWRNVTYQTNSIGLDLKRNSKTILKQLSGHFRYHSLNGLMGPSGAGKTTLLNCLCAQTRSGLSPQSEIYVNGSESESTSCYI